MIEHHGDLYIVGLGEITSPKCYEEPALAVELDWPTVTGFAESARIHGFELCWPRKHRAPSLRSHNADIVYLLDRLNPTYRSITDARGELFLFAKRAEDVTPPTTKLPQRFRNDLPKAPTFLADAMISIEEQKCFRYLLLDVQDTDQVEQLLRNLFDFPEAAFELTAPTDASLPAALKTAIDANNILIRRTDLHFYRAPDPRDDGDFLQVPPGSAKFEWQVKAQQSERFSRYTLALSEKKRRDLEVEQHILEHSKKSTNPLKLEPNFMGLGVDLKKLWRLARAWFGDRSK